MPSLRKCAVAGAVAAFCTIAGAQQGAQMGPCKQDAEKLCKDVQPGGGRMLECLKSHQSEVSKACKTNLTQVQQALKQVSQACEPDVEKYCMDTPTGKGAIVNCLKKHQTDVSSECQGTLVKVKARAKPKQ